jgi:chromate transporter
VAGALVATVALYIPAVVLMLALSHEYERFRGDSRFEDFLAGVTPAVVGLVASAAFLLGQQVLHSWQAYLVGACSLLLVTSFRWPPAAILALGALLGMTSWLP